VCVCVCVCARERERVVNLVHQKVKVNCTLVHALRLCTGRTALMESRGIALLYLDHVTRRGEGSASRPDRSLPPGKTRYPLYRRLGGPQGWSGQVRKISPPPGSDPLVHQVVYELKTVSTALTVRDCYHITQTIRRNRKSRLDPNMGFPSSQAPGQLPCLHLAYENQVHH